MASRIARKRCVVLLGRSGAGKSTVANHLVGHDPLSPDKPPFRVNHELLASRTTEVEHNTVEFMWENDLYRLTVVDTPGLDSLFNESDYHIIFDKIVQYIRETKLRIDLILFVFMKGRFTAEERYVFSFFMEKFHKNRGIAGCPQDISSISALVVTRCEEDDTTKREKLVQEFKVVPRIREIASQMRMGIYPVGFPRLKYISPPLQETFRLQMVKDRDTVRELIVRTRPSTDVKLTMANLTSLKTAEGGNLEIIETVAPKWKTVGYLMDFDPDGRKVDVIEANYAHRQNGVVTCCQEIFKLWLRGKDATWKKLNEILNSSGHKVLAEQVMDAVGLL